MNADTEISLKAPAKAGKRDRLSMQDDDPKQAMESLIGALFEALLWLARGQGISIKYMRELISTVQLQALSECGLSQQQLMAESGYTRKWVRELLSDPIRPNACNPIDRFVSNWAADQAFPDKLSLNGDYPSYKDLHDCYGGDFTAPGLLKILKARDIVKVDEEHVTLHAGREVTAQEDAEKIRAAQSSITALMNTLRHNLEGQGTPWMERRLWSQHIPVENVEQLREAMTTLNREHYERILSLLRDHHAAPDDDATKCTRVGVGLYWFEEGNAQ